MVNTVAGIHLGKDTHANGPVATAFPTGTLYSCSDHGLIYRSDGSTWSDWATLGGGGTTVDTARMSNAAAQSNPNNTVTIVTFDTEDWDDNGSIVDLANN